MTRTVLRIFWTPLIFLLGCTLKLATAETETNFLYTNSTGTGLPVLRRLVTRVELVLCFLNTKGSACSRSYKVACHERLKERWNKAEGTGTEDTVGCLSRDSDYPIQIATPLHRVLYMLRIRHFDGNCCDIFSVTYILRVILQVNNARCVESSL